MSDDGLLISVKTAAARLDCSTGVVYDLLNRQLIESVYMGSRRKVVVASLDKYVRSLRPYPDAS